MYHVGIGNFLVSDNNLPGQKLLLNKCKVYIPNDGEKDVYIYKFSKKYAKLAKKIGLIYARDTESMKFLDDIYRRFVSDKLKFVKGQNDVVMIKSPAGSGKTTTLRQLCEKHAQDCRILYTAFNTAVVEAFATNKNVFPKTFDSIMNTVYPADIKYLNDEEIKNYRPEIVKKFTKFCNGLDTIDNHPDLRKIWKDVVDNKFQTHDSVRKLVYTQPELKKLFDAYMCENYDVIFIDEAQDFDLVMLHLISDLPIPKLFVGESLQSIYGWRGCIDVFDHVKSGLLIEFYSSFRTKDPLCTRLTQMFKDCWMIPAGNGRTIATSDFKKFKNKYQGSYTHLFRSRYNLIEAARKYNDKLWIHDFDTMCAEIHQILKWKKINQRDWIVDNIRQKIVAKEEATCKMYTIHAFKGLEDDYVVVDNDIKPEETNLQYVAYTRAKKILIKM